MKRQPCNYCAARGGKKHAAKCSRPSVTKAVSSSCHRQELVNHIALIVDHSQSMHPLRWDALKVLNDQIAEIKNNAIKLGQRTSLSLYEFSDSASRTAFKENILDFEPLSYYNVGGWTALYDAVGLAINDFATRKDANNSNVSFLIIVITDGEENKSKYFHADSIADAIRNVEKTDRWTFVFSVPYGQARVINKLGIPAGNIQEWEQTKLGIDTLSHNTSVGISHYYGCRNSGITRSRSFFQPDLSKVPTKLIRNLQDISHQYHTWRVTAADPISIKDFVENKLCNQPGLAKKIGSNYKIGWAYYQLTKTETVQDGKDIILLDKSTNALYGGWEAKELIGCPSNGDFKIKPGDHNNYEIFIKSTSVNRKLMAGTKVLYFTG